MAPYEKKNKRVATNRRPKEDQAKLFSSSVILDLGLWNRFGHSGPSMFKTRGIVKEMVRDIGVFRSRSRRWPAAGREEKRKKHSLSFSANPTKHPAGVRTKKKTRGLAQKTPNVLELSLSVLAGLETSTKTSRKWRQNRDKMAGRVWNTANLPRPLL